MNLVSRFTSRKFLLALGAAVTAFSQHQYAAGGAIVIGYMAAEGIIDHKAVNTAQAVESQAHDLAVQIFAQLKEQQPASTARTAARTGKRA